MAVSGAVKAAVQWTVYGDRPPDVTEWSLFVVTRTCDDTDFPTKIVGETLLPLAVWARPGGKPVIHGGCDHGKVQVHHSSCVALQIALGQRFAGAHLGATYFCATEGFWAD